MLFQNCSEKLSYLLMSNLSHSYFYKYTSNNFLIFLPNRNRKPHRFLRQQKPTHKVNFQLLRSRLRPTN